MNSRQRQVRKRKIKRDTLKASRLLLMRRMAKTTMRPHADQHGIMKTLRVIKDAGINVVAIPGMYGSMGVMK